MRLYLASSWRNEHQPTVLAQLRDAGHEVYDFRNPAPGNTGFGWSKVDPLLKEDLTVERMRRALGHEVAQAAFDHDFNAMKWADACVLLLPCGMSAHLEAGWFAGAGKPVCICAPEIRQPELMYKCFDAHNSTPIFESGLGVISFLCGLVQASLRVAARTKEFEPTLEQRVQVLERLLCGAREDPSDLNYPKPPRHPGLLAQVDAMWRFVGGMSMSPGTPSTSLSSQIERQIRERESHEAWRRAQEREAGTVRGRIRGLLQRAINATYRTRDAGDGLTQAENDIMRDIRVMPLGIFDK